MRRPWMASKRLMKKAIRFKFGDRVDVTTSEIRPLVARVAFLRSLIRQDFKATDPLVRYFYFECFHDGAIRIDGFDLSRSRLVVMFENVSAMDRVTASTLKRKHAFDRARYETQVIFEGVSEFEVRSTKPVEALKYYSAEFWKSKESFELRIYFSHEFTARELGLIRVKFRTIEVEDISSKLRGLADKPSDLAVWLIKKPLKLMSQLQNEIKHLRSLRAKGRT